MFFVIFFLFGVSAQNFELILDSDTQFSTLNYR